LIPYFSRRNATNILDSYTVDIPQNFNMSASRTSKIKACSKTRSGTTDFSKGNSKKTQKFGETQETPILN
jgi:hypothetical protein